MKVKIKNLSGVSFTQLKNVISHEVLRPSVCGVNINLKYSRLECTNAHLLLMYPIEIIESDITEYSDSLVVPARFFNVLKYMIDIPKKYIELLEYVLTDEFAEVYFGEELVYRCKYIDAKFPNIQAVLPTDEWKRENPKKVGLNINNLEKLMKGIPYNFPNNFTFDIYAKNKGLFLETLQEPKIKGMIMPIMLRAND
jgi:DNA polymerase III sliding clamp (beta) subunit (PCNA family)